MIYEHYGLEIDPFSLRPDLDFLFLSKAHEEAIAHLIYGLEQNEDVTLIVGDIGTGKTLALNRLLDGIPDDLLAVNINVTTLDFAGLLSLVMRKLDMQIPDNAGLDALLHGFEKFLVDARRRGRKVLLVIDEVQNLDLSTLEGVRLLMNLAQPGGQALQLVLSGQLGLIEKVNHPEMRQLRQRIRVEYSLEHLDRDETARYVSHRLRTAGRESPLFDRSALDRIHALSGGVPRLVNQFASAALLAGFVAKSDRVRAEHVEAVEAKFHDPLSGGSGDLAAERSQTSAPEPVAPQMPRAEPPREERPAEPVRDEAPTRATSREGEKFARRRSSGPGPGRVLITTAIIVALAAVLYLTSDQWLTAFERPAAETTGAPAATAVPDRTTEMTPDPAPETEEQMAGSTGTTALAEEIEAVDTADNDPVAASVEPEPALSLAQVPGDTGFVVHVASFAAPDRAASLRRRLGERGLTTFTRVKTAANGKVWHRVYLDPFATREAAQEVVDELTAARAIQYSMIVELPFS